MFRSILSIILQLAVWAVISWFLIAWVQGCVSAEPVATSSIGTVIRVERDLVLVTFPVVNRKPGSQAANWFYIPGHGFQLRDRYPDPSKDPAFQIQSYGDR